MDATGYRFGEVMLGTTEDGLWVDYVFFNPKTGKQDVKHSWVVQARRVESSAPGGMKVMKHNGPDFQLPAVYN